MLRSNLNGRSLEKNPTPVAKYLNEAEAEEVKQTLERVQQELYGEPPLEITQKDSEVRVYGDKGYEVLSQTEQILEKPFFENRKAARDILENLTDKNYQETV